MEQDESDDDDDNYDDDYKALIDLSYLTVPLILIIIQWQKLKENTLFSPNEY